MPALQDDPGPFPQSDTNSEPQVKLSSSSEYVRAAITASNGTEFRREFSDVTLAYDDGQVQSYKGLLALLSPWLEQLLLAAGGLCDMVILPGTDSQSSPLQLFMQQFLMPTESCGEAKFPDNTVKKECSENKIEGHKTIYSIFTDFPENEVLGSVEQSEPQLKCDGSKKCKRVFKSETNLFKHKLSWHPGNKTHTCVPCKRDYENKTCLNRHFKRFHKGVLETDLTCRDCSEVLATREKLEYHRRHQHEAGYCSKCDKVFISRRKLKSHRSTCLKKQNHKVKF